MLNEICFLFVCAFVCCYFTVDVFVVYFFSDFIWALSVLILAQVIDTPDINHLSLNRRQKQEQVAGWKELTSPGPTIILMTVRCDIRYTAEEKVIYDEIKKLWGNTDFSRRLVVAFTFGDRQDDNLEEELLSLVHHRPR